MRSIIIPIAMAAMPTPIVQYNVCDPQILVVCLFHTGTVSGFSVLTISYITRKHICEGSREVFVRIAATIDMESFLKTSS